MKTKQTLLSTRGRADPHRAELLPLDGDKTGKDGRIGSHTRTNFGDDTRNWWPEKKVLVSPQWIERVSWDESRVFVNLSRETIKQSPEFTEESPLTRDYEIGLHGHYNRQGYWVAEAVATSNTKGNQGGSQLTSKSSHTTH